MKRFAFALCALSVFAIVSCNDGGSNTAAKTDTTKPAEAIAAEPSSPPPPMDSAAMMKAWMDYMTPGETHKMLASQSGNWTSEVKMWMDPAAPPTVSKSKDVYRMILGGRYQECKHTGSFNGQPFEGISTLAYDNARKKFISSWIDNMGTGLMVMEGDYDPATKTLSLKGDMVDPTTGKNCKVREVVTFVDDKTMTMEMYNNPSGMDKEFKAMEIKSVKQ